jgi:hypothetical protein
MPSEIYINLEEPFSKKGSTFRLETSGPWSDLATQDILCCHDPRRLWKKTIQKTN